MAPSLSRQLALVDARVAQPFGAGAFEEFQVVRVEDDAAGIGVFVINADIPVERYGHIVLFSCC
jgi:hypothetical protein